MSVLNQSGDDVVECPLCMEPLEVDDLNFFPCTCGYQICRFCWHRIRIDENGLCPACRKAYSENPADFKPLSKEEISRLKAEKRLKDQQRKQRVTENRKHLANVRVVQKNLVFVVGLPMRLADADVLKRHEYFGKFGKIHKVVINQSTSYAGSQGPSASAYVTYQRQEDALRAIEAVNNIIVDGRTIKTSLGTTKYCSHFMRNQACPKPDCMYLHDLGDQEASFTKEEMHQGKHQEYERKLVQSLHAHASTVPNRKPTVSPPIGNNSTRENGVVSVSQIKEAWPSLNPGQPNNSSVMCKDTITSSTQIFVQQQSNESGIISSTMTTSVTTTTTTTPNLAALTPNINTSSQQNNNNKGEGISGSVLNTRRGKSNSESKAQAARNKHKNNQNKEKHSSTRTTSRSESSSSGNGAQSIERSQVNGQKLARNYINDTTTNNNNNSSSSISNDSANNQQTATTTNGRCQNEQYQKQNNHSNRQNHRQGNETTTGIEQSVQDIKLNGITRNGDQCNSESENEQQREGSTPASTDSSSGSEDSTSNNTIERFIDATDEHCNSSDILESSPLIGTQNVAPPVSNAGQVAPPGLQTINGTQTHVNHRSIFQTDNNSFFSSNTFQKISNVMALPSTSQSVNASTDWTTTCLATIPDSLPAVHSSEDWQAAFGFQPEKCRPNHVTLSPTSSSPNNPFNAENFVDDNYLDSQYDTPPSKLRSAFDPNVHINNTPASKFMADFQQNSRQQRLVLQAQQNQENCEYIKQNGHGVDVPVKQEGADIKPDDDLGFDPFHETQKALAELMENEMQLQQQRMFQQQQQQQQIHQRNREEHNRPQHQGFASTLGSQHFSQVAHLAHLHQAHHLQNLQVLQQSHTILSRLPQSMLQQTSVQNPVQPSATSVGGNIGQRSRLPPPGFPSSTPNHMNSFGLGIPRAASATSTLTSGQPPQQTSYLPNSNSLITQQGVTKCANETIYGLKEWCEIGGPQVQQQQQQQQQQATQSFHHQQLHQKSGWNNFGPVNDWTSIDPAIVSSSRPPLPFQATSTWQFSRFHPTIHNVPHNTQQEQNAPAQHWAMQPPPGFGGPATNMQLNGQQTSTTAQPHSKLISAGPEIENC